MPESPYTLTHADLSPCGLYRYSLTRRWSNDQQEPSLAFVMLNPSTADAREDDATIRRCVAFAKREGFAGMFVANLFAFRATDPKELATATDPVGPRGDEFLERTFKAAASHSLPVVLAWGADPRAVGRGREVVAMARVAKARTFCLGKTQGGQPKHPLYLPSDAPLIAY